MFKSYQASAGSGKTTHLVAAYLSICFEALSRGYLNGYKHILAITFTNNATAEMKERILSTLSHFAFTGDYSALSSSHQAILKMIRQNSDQNGEWDDDKVKTFATLLLKEMLYNYNDFSVSTIDSFFQRIVRGFAIELGLNLNFNLEIDESEFFSQAIELLLSKISQQEYDTPFSLSKQVMAIVDRNLDDHGKNKLEKELRDFLRIIHKEDAHQALKSLQNVDRQIFKEYCLQLVERRDKAKSNLLKTAEKGDRLFKESGLNAEDFAGKSKGPYFWFQKLMNDPALLPGCKMQESVEKGSFLHEAFLKKNPGVSFDDRQAIALYNEAVALHALYVELKVLCENINTFTLIFDLQEILHDIKSQDNLFFLSETNALINDEIGENDTPFIFEKMGNRYQDFLIDEFQDTSKMQWENLLPLIKNALSGGFSQRGKTILFGDAKQAIYRFRSGEASLFQELSTMEGYKKAMGWGSAQEGDFYREALTTNYRSSKAIVDFNNKFFSCLKEITNKGELVFSKAATYYSDLVQDNPEGISKKGFVAVRFKNDDDGDDYLVEEVLAAVRDALNRNFNYSDIAVLSRGKESSVKYARSLSQHGFPVISSDSLLLNSSEEVRVMIASLHYLLNNENDVAKTVILAYLHDKNDSQQTLNERLTSLKVSSFPSILKDFKIDLDEEKLCEYPLYTLIKELMSLYDFQTANAYISTFLDKVRDFADGKICSISSFLDWWEEKGGTLSLSSPKNFNAITVTTVHKSKGLQYPIVIFPFSSYRYALTKPTIWHKSNDEEAVPYFPVRLSSKLEGTFLEEIYNEENAMSRLDDLNILYVAHTRPVYGFYIITEKKNGRNYGKYLAHFISTISEEERDCYWFGEEDFRIEKRETEMQETSSQLLPLSRFTPSEGQLIYSKITHANQRQVLGIAIHDYLSKMEKFPKSQMEIENLNTNLDEKSDARIKKALSSIMEDEVMAPFFSDQAKSLREMSIVNAEGKLFRPDRIAILNNQVLVVDYKTGQEKEADQCQLQQYIELLKEMGYSHVEGKLIYI